MRPLSICNESACEDVLYILSEIGALPARFILFCLMEYLFLPPVHPSLVRVSNRHPSMRIDPFHGNASHYRDSLVTGALSEARTKLPESNSWPFPPKTAHSRNLALASLKTAVLNLV